MAVTKKELEEAVFWDRHVCLECASIAEGTEEAGNCEHCGSVEPLMPAALVVKVLAVVEEEDVDG